MTPPPTSDTAARADLPRLLTAWMLHVTVLAAALLWPILQVIPDVSRLGLLPDHGLGWLLTQLQCDPVLMRMELRGIVAWSVVMLLMLLAPWKPALGPVLFAGLAMTYEYDQFGPHLSRNLWLTALAVTGTIVWMTRTHTRLCLPPRRSWPTWLMLVLSVWVGLTTYLAWRRTGIWQPSLSHHPALFLCAPVMFLLASQFLAERVTSLWLALGMLGLLALRVRWMYPGGIWLNEDVASLLVLTLPLALLAGQAALRPKVRLGVGILAGLLATHNLWKLLATHNRASLVALAVMLAALAWITRYRWILLPLALLAIAGGAYELLTTEVGQRFRDLWTNGPEAGSAWERLRIWKHAWQLALENPVWGVGMGDFERLLAQRDPHLGPMSEHNNFIAMLVRAGFPGLALYTALFVGLLIHLWRTSELAHHDWPGPAARVLFACLTGYLTVGLFITRHDLVVAYILGGWAVAIYNHMAGPDLLRPPQEKPSLL